MSTIDWKRVGRVTERVGPVIGAVVAAIALAANFTAVLSFLGLSTESKPKAIPTFAAQRTNLATAAARSGQ